MDGVGQPIETPAAPNRAVEALFRRYYRWLAAALRRRYGPEMAEDLAQETYLRMAGRDDAEAIRHPRALLMQIARNAATDRYRHTRRETEATVWAPDIDAFPTAPVQQQAVMIKQIVLALPPKLRDVFVLSQLQGLTHQEIAGLLGISVKTVEWRMRKALVRCVSAMQD